MFLRITCLLVIATSLVSCNRDHKKETISNYLHYVWRRQPGEIEIKRMTDVKSIKGIDSIDLLIKEYAKGITPQPTLDTILSRIARDIDYNSKLLFKTNARIDSLKAFQEKIKSNDDFLKTNMKIYTDLRDFTTLQIEELKMYQGSFKRYASKKENVFCYEILCQYKLKEHEPDTTSKLVTQTFYLTPDTKRIFLVK